MTKKSVEYEKYVKDVYEAILKDEGNGKIKVEHNIKLIGKSGQEHQIDVYWEYKIGRETGRIIIECKDYSSVISIGKVRDFYGVIQDVGNVKGIMASKVGYQKGAKKFADFHDIILKEVRVPKDEDWSGRVKKIDVRFSLIAPDVKSRNILPDEEWIKQNPGLIKPETKLGGFSDKIFLQDEKGKLIKTLAELEKLLKLDCKQSEGNKQKFDFQDTYICFPEIPPIKIRAIEYIYNIVKGEEEHLVINGDKLAKAVIKNVKDGEITFIDKNGKVK